MVSIHIYIGIQLNIGEVYIYIENKTERKGVHGTKHIH